MWKLFASLLLLIVFQGTLCNARKTLVLLESLGARDAYSLFFKSMKERGHEITYRTADDPSLALSKYGEFLYDNLVIFAPSVREFGGQIDVKAILSFIDGGKNVIVAADSSVSDVIRELGSECGVEFDEENTNVIDHVNFDKNDMSGKHTTIVVPSENLMANKHVIGPVENYKNPFLFKGVGIANDAENPLLITVLRASKTAYSYNPNKKIDDYPTAVGESMSLITALQARNNARMLFVGSIEFFSDDFFERNVQSSSPTSNKDLSIILSRWTFGERGVLRAFNATHKRTHQYRQEQTEKAELLEDKPVDHSAYTIMDDVEFTIHIEELYDLDSEGKKQGWRPYNGDDVTMEFVRIDPFVRKIMSQRKSDGVYYLKFKLPDVYGVFKFLVNYNRVGLTRLHSSTQVSVRPLRHTQYERYIHAAFPYYLSSFSMMAGLFIFCFVFLYYREPSNKSKTE